MKCGRQVKRLWKRETGVDKTIKTKQVLKTKKDGTLVLDDKGEPVTRLVVKTRRVAGKTPLKAWVKDVLSGRVEGLDRVDHKFVGGWAAAKGLGKRRAR